jgi:hypothetical protein
MLFRPIREKRNSLLFNKKDSRRKLKRRLLFWKRYLIVNSHYYTISHVFSCNNIDVFFCRLSFAQLLTRQNKNQLRRRCLYRNTKQKDSLFTPISLRITTWKFLPTIFLFVNLLNGTEDSKPSRGGQNVGTLIFRFLISVCADIFVPTLPFAEMAWIVYLSITHK